MKKLVVCAVVALVAGSAMADTGWYNDYMYITKNGGAGYNYNLSNPGDWDGAVLGDTYSLTLTNLTFYYHSDSADRTGGSFGIKSSIAIAPQS